MRLAGIAPHIHFDERARPAVRRLLGRRARSALCRFLFPRESEPLRRCPQQVPPGEEVQQGRLLPTISSKSCSRRISSWVDVLCLQLILQSLDFGQGGADRSSACSRSSSAPARAANVCNTEIQSGSSGIGFGR